MRVLLDTHLAFWWQTGDERLSPEARRLAESADQVFVSSISLWELTIKAGLGKLKLGYSLDTDLPRLFEENGFEVIAPDWRAVTGVQQLEPVHGDPFDRIQVIQARQRGMDIISRDPVFDRYGLRRVW